MRISHPFVKDIRKSFSNGTVIHQKIRFYKVRSYVGLFAPKDIGGSILSYEICYKESNCTTGNIGLFGSNLAPVKQSKIRIDKDNLIIHESLISSDDQNIYEAVQWKEIHLTEVR